MGKIVIRLVVRRKKTEEIQQIRVGTGTPHRDALCACPFIYKHERIWLQGRKTRIVGRRATRAVRRCHPRRPFRPISMMLDSREGRWFPGSCGIAGRLQFEVVRVFRSW